MPTIQCPRCEQHIVIWSDAIAAMCFHYGDSHPTVECWHEEIHETVRKQRPQDERYGCGHRL